MRYRVKVTLLRRAKSLPLRICGAIIWRKCVKQMKTKAIVMEDALRLLLLIKRATGSEFPSAPTWAV